ncbi:MAG TPA: hypothetical protein VL094_12485 [Sphingomonadaceae bacterium]|nr:hypothetical protein [Sphingomonadaceae bacterium]
MPIFLITYDVRNAQNNKHDYTGFLQEFKKQKCLQIQRGTYLGSFNNTAAQVHNHFKTLMDKPDSLLVSELVQHFAYTGAAKNIGKWLELNPPAKLGVATEAPAPSAEAKPAAKAKAPAKAKAKAD